MKTTIILAFVIIYLYNIGCCFACVKSDSAKTTGCKYSFPFKQLFKLFQIIYYTFLLIKIFIAQDAYVPTSKKEVWWMERHEKFKKYSEENSEGIKLVFLGDSIMQGWQEEGNLTFHKYYSKYGVANYGISADRTQHLLWRIRNGELNNLKPLLIVLLIGTNNLAYNKDIEIYKGVKANVLELRRRLPNSKILVFNFSSLVYS